ncbi:MAG: hypothetical protein K0Q63_3024 [Paenibacillus sp.]|nr:hypothetical protein [Paenibacillus sp.]
MKQRPSSEEYAAYYHTYVGKVPEGDIVQLLEGGLSAGLSYWSGLSEEQAEYRYAENKWSLKEVLGHIADTEAIMSYRLLRVARGDVQPLLGFDQDLYMPASAFDAVPLSMLIDRYESTRRSTLALLRTLPAGAWTRWGNASGADVTVLALAYIIAGHELHHMSVVVER